MVGAYLFIYLKNIILNSNILLDILIKLVLNLK